jgi:hypothetical protein
MRFGDDVNENSSQMDEIKYSSRIQNNKNETVFTN